MRSWAEEPRAARVTQCHPVSMPALVGTGQLSPLGPWQHLGCRPGPKDPTLGCLEVPWKEDPWPPWASAHLSVKWGFLPSMS